MNLAKNPKFLGQLADAIKEREGAAGPKIDGPAIAEKIKSRVLGQDAIADTVASFIARRASRPKARGTLANILISGPTGTGKTEMAKTISEAVFGSEDHMLPILCNTLGSSGDAMAALVGAPAVYRGSSKGSIIEYLVKNKGQGVILFDEIEKAITHDGVPSKDAPILKMLLTLLDEGKIQSQYDMSVHEAKGCIVILTSNLKQKELGELAKQVTDPEELERACKRVLQDAFAPEFLARLDLVTTTAPLSDTVRAQICLMHFERLAKIYGIEITDLAPGFFPFLLEGAERFKEGDNTREVLRWIEKLAEDPLIDVVHEHKWKRVVADWDGQRIVLSPSPEAEE